AAAGGAALQPEDRAERRFAQAHRGLLAEPVEAVAQADRGRRLALARRGGADRGDEDELAVGTSFEARDPVERYLALGAAVGNERVFRDRETLGDFRNREQFPLLGDLDVSQHCLSLRVVAEIAIGESA